MGKFTGDALMWIFFFCLVVAIGVSGFAMVMVLKALFRMAF